MARAHHTITVALLVSASCFAASPAHARSRPEPTQPFTVQDLVRLERMSEIAAAPDGRRVAFTRRVTDMDANAGRTTVWVVDSGKRGAPALRITDPGANAKSAEWSADGKYLYFLSNKSGTFQVWRAAPPAATARDGSTAAATLPAVQITNLPLEVGTFRVSPKGNRIVVSMDVFTDCADLACTRQRLDDTSRSKATGRLYRQLFVRHWDTWSDGRRSQLFSMALDDTAHGNPVPLSAGIGDVPGKPFGDRADFAISPDGAEVAFSVRAGNAQEPWSTNFDIYAVSIDGGTPRNLTADNPAWDGQPAYSPDGTQLAYLAMDRPGFEADRFHLVLLDVKSGIKRPLTQGWDRSIASFEWARDGKTLFATADHLGQHPLWTIDAKTGRASAITGSGEVENFSVGTGKVFYAFSTLAAPADLFSVGFGGGDARQLTHLNQALLAQRTLGDFEQFNFAGANNDNVFGYVVKPPGFKRDQKYPIAFLVHGGPQGSFGNAWSWRWNAQAFAAPGYGVVMIDFHGSTGYGQAFTDSISGDWGGKPLEDLKLGLAAAIKQYPWLDGDHACALGASYGGFMMNWIEGQWPDRFKCIVTHDGILDARAMYYSTDELWFEEWENGGPEYQNPAGYAKFNPVDYVSRWRTPTLVIHGQQDFRIPESQGLGVFTALQRRGIPSELLVFPNENHWVLKPADSVEWYDTVLGWVNKWIKQ
ncbi:MAG TPA: S9 family peptidase [Steroidobacteraceae bacterium]|jgi:dipeptidyl aminopeptidase/acylaminoacyl peptidase|nr:S9 family peptidase [Steroidobacteraceae bacterium]